MIATTKRRPMGSLKSFLVNLSPLQLVRVPSHDIPTFRNSARNAGLRVHAFVDSVRPEFSFFTILPPSP